MAWCRINRHNRRASRFGMRLCSLPMACFWLSVLGMLGAQTGAASAAPDDGLIVGMDYTVNDTSIPIWVRFEGAWRVLTSGVPAWGMAADNDNCTLWISSLGGALYRYRSGENFPTLVTFIRVDTVATAMPGLAYFNGTLYGSLVTGVEGIFSINTTTGAATRVCTTNIGFDFSGLDIDPATGQLYGVSDAAPMGQSPGLYRINLSTGVATAVVSYPIPFPGAGATADVDGLALGDGAAYMIVDQPGNIAVYDLASGTFRPQYANPFTLSRTFASGAFAECFAVAPCIADIDLSGGVDGFDIGAFFILFEQGLIDIDQSGGVDGFDVAAFFVRFEAGC